MESLCFDALLFRFDFYNYFGGRGHGYYYSGRDDMLLNPKHYFNFNITAMNVCSTPCLVLVLWTRSNLTSSRRSINHSPTHRPAISDIPSLATTAKVRHGTDERRAKLLSCSATLYVHRNWSRQTRPEKRSLLPTKKKFRRICAISRRQMPEICR